MFGIIKLHLMVKRAYNVKIVVTVQDEKKKVLITKKK